MVDTTDLGIAALAYVNKAGNLKSFIDGESRSATIYLGSHKKSSQYHKAWYQLSHGGQTL